MNSTTHSGTEKTTTKAVALNARRKKKSEGRKKRTQKLRSDVEFAKKYFEGKAKRAADKKSAYRKKKSKKK